MAITFLGLTIGDNGTGFIIPTYAQWREALSIQIRQLRGIANLQTQPGSPFGDFIDLVTTGLDLASQAASLAVSRTVFTAMGGVALDQFLADILIRVVASASTAVIWVYGGAGAAVPQGSPVRSSPTGTPFLTLAPVAVPAAPAEAYGIEILPFGAGAYLGQDFTVTVDGTPVVVAAGAGNGLDMRNNLVLAINAAAGVTPFAYRGGINPTNGRYTLMVIEENGGGSFPLTVSNGGAVAMFAFSAISVNASTFPITGPTVGNAEALRIGTPFANVQGYTNVLPAIAGRNRETDSQFKARHLVTQRGLGGGSPDAVKGIMLQPVEVGGGGLTYCAVEYNPTSLPDINENKPHSLRIVANADVNPTDLGNALWRAKAAGDDTNGDEIVIIQDAEGNNQTLQYSLLEDVWIAAIIVVEVGQDWPNTGSPLDQLRQDVTDYINALQPTGSNYGVRVNQLPISLYPNGLPRGVANFTVSLGQSATQGGPYAYNAAWPDPLPDAQAASIQLSSRKKARADFVDILASFAP